jgi:chromosome segregation ATPase
MRFSNVFLALAATTLLATGCAQQKAPANKALDAIEASLKDVRDDAAKYAPDGLKGVEAQFARLKESYDKKEYENVLAGTPELNKAVDSLKDAVASGKKHAAAALAAAKSEWENLNTEVPKMVENIETRVNELSKQKIHFKVTKDELASAKSGLEWMKTEWAEATTASSSGKEILAAEKARAVKAKGEEVQKTLGMKEA